MAELGQARAVFEGHGGFGFARAHRVEEIDEDVFRTRQGLGRSRRLFHFLVGNDVHLVAVGAGENDALLADVKRAAVAGVESFVGILSRSSSRSAGRLRSSPWTARKFPCGLPVVVLRSILRTNKL